MAHSHAPTAFPRFARFGQNVLVTWDESDRATDTYLHAAILLGLALVTRDGTAHDEGDIAALRDIEGRIESEITRLHRMQKSNDQIRSHSDTIGDEIRKAQKQLDLLLRKAKETLKTLQVELCEEGAEREFPIALPNDSLQEASNAIQGCDADLAAPE